MPMNELLPAPRGLRSLAANSIEWDRNSLAAPRAVGQFPVGLFPRLPLFPQPCPPICFLRTGDFALRPDGLNTQPPPSEPKSPQPRLIPEAAAADRDACDAPDKASPPSARPSLDLLAFPLRSVR